MALVLNGSGITSANIVNGTIVDEDIADVAASKLTGALPAISGAALTNLPASGNTTVYNITDSTDITVAITESGANAIGSSFSINIPTRGIIRLATIDATVIGTGASFINPYFGFKIGSTVYPFIYYKNNTTTNVTENFGGSTSGAYLTLKGSAELVASIAAMVYVDSMPTGEQTVSLVVWEKEGDSGGVFKGTTRTIDISIEVLDAT